MLKVMQEDGFTMNEHYSKTLDELKDIDFAVVVTLCDHANETCPIYLKKQNSYTGALKIHLQQVEQMKKY